jgi:hypothetical protein
MQLLHFTTPAKQSIVLLVMESGLWCIEDIEALPAEGKDKVYYFIDMALSHHKAKKAFVNK